VILERGHWARAERDEKRLGARALGVGVELHFLRAPLEVLIERAERRTAPDEWTAPPMTRAHFEDWETIVQTPDEEELLRFDRPIADVWVRRPRLTVEPGRPTRVGAGRLPGVPGMCRPGVRDDR
jgi:predicted kinase